MPTLGTVNLCIEGLAIICFHPNQITQKVEAQIAFILDPQHELYVLVNGVKQTQLVNGVEETLSFAAGDRLNLKATKPVLPYSYFIDSPIPDDRSRTDVNPNSFLWLVDLEGEIHGQQLTLLNSTTTPKRCREVALLTVENAEFAAGSFFSDASDSPVKLLKDLAPDSGDFGYAADVARARIECDLVPGSKVSLTKTDAHGAHSIPIEVKITDATPQSICFLNIEKTHHSRCDPNHPGVGVPTSAGDFQLIYHVVADPDGKKYDLKKPAPTTDTESNADTKSTVDREIFTPPYKVCDVNFMSMTTDLTPLTSE